MQLPDFPWDSLVPYRERAKAHPGGLIDLSVGSPVDATVESAKRGLARGENSPGYPMAAGSAELNDAIASWFREVRHASGITPDHTMPVIGSKELVALLPLLLGLTADDTVVFPEIAYPTYEVGARVSGAKSHATDDPESWPSSTRLVWINSPANPTGQVLSVPELRELVDRARSIGALLVSDECYGLLGSTDQPEAPSVLHDDVLGGDYRSVLAVHSLSKQANMAGYRAAFVAGDPTVIAQIVQPRRHLGLMVPAPIQTAVVDALADRDSVVAQRATYGARRDILRQAVKDAEWRVDHSEAGLYLWVSRGQSAEESVAWFADRGILVTPGHFYGPSGSDHVRIALTVSDDQAREAARRIRG